MFSLRLESLTLDLRVDPDELAVEDLLDVAEYLDGVVSRG